MKALLVFCAIATLLVGCQNRAAAPAAAPATPVARGMAWTAQGDNWAQDKAKLQALGEQFDTSWALYEKLKADAGGGTKLKWEQLSLPSLRLVRNLHAHEGRSALRSGSRAQRRPGVRAADARGATGRRRQARADRRTGGEYDPISDCRPPGTPRWFTEPFLHEFIVTPDQTWLIE